MNEPPPWLATFAAQMNQNLANLNAELNQSFANLNAELNQTSANLSAGLNQISANLNKTSANLDKTSANLSQALANLTAKLDGIQNILRYEVPVRLANISRAPNPGAAMGGFPPLLEPPNPRTQDELMTFTGESSILSLYMYTYSLQFSSALLLPRILGCLL
jgi:ABC-type transporter Mla subunit MlaD